MDEQSILKQLNLSESDAKDLVQKYEAFLTSLNPAQRAVLEASLPNAADAAKSLGPSAEDLTSFVNNRMSKSQPSTSLMFFVAPQK
jgi:hypothetical protein